MKAGGFVESGDGRADRRPPRSTPTPRRCSPPSPSSAVDDARRRADAGACDGRRRRCAPASTADARNRPLPDTCSSVEDLVVEYRVAATDASAPSTTCRSPSPRAAPWPSSASRAAASRRSPRPSSGCSTPTSGASCSTAPTSRPLSETAAAPAAAPDPDGVPGPVRLARPAPDAPQRDRRRAAAAARACARARPGAHRGRRAHRPGRAADAPRSHRKPARVLRRAAPAHRHRPGAGVRAPTCWSATRRPARWTSPSRPRCSSCCASIQAETGLTYLVHLAQPRRGARDQRDRARHARRPRSWSSGATAAGARRARRALHPAPAPRRARPGHHERASSRATSSATSPPPGPPRPRGRMTTQPTTDLPGSTAALPRLVLGTMTFGDTVDVDAAARDGRRRAGRRHHLDRHRQRLRRRAQRDDARGSPDCSRAAATSRAGHEGRHAAPRRRRTPAAVGRRPARSARGEPRRRLGTDHVDLFYLHQPDRLGPAGGDPRARSPSSSPRARSRALGVSNFAAWQIGDVDARRRRRRRPAPRRRPAALQPRGPPHRGGVRSSSPPTTASRRWSTTRSAAACSPGGTASTRRRPRAASATRGSPRCTRSGTGTSALRGDRRASGRIAGDAGSAVTLAELALRWLPGARASAAVLLGGSQPSQLRGQHRRRSAAGRWPPTSSPPATRSAPRCAGPMPAYNR